MREILLPAHRLLHAQEDVSLPKQWLTVPSATYDTLRATLVQAELILLRVLGYELRLPLPLDFLPRYLTRALQDATAAAEDYDSWGKEERKEYGVVSKATDTGIGKACVIKVIEA